MATKHNRTMTDADQFSPTQDAVAVLAYKLWADRQRPIGSPEQDWFEAIHQIEHSRTPGCVA
jgi:Protein of unknown function (DUF2934)